MPDGAQRSPTIPLETDEEIAQSFRPDRATYLRDNAWMAAAAMAGGMAILWAMGSPHVWTGAVGGLAAIGLRGWYMASEELAVRWDVTGTRLLGPGGRAIPLASIARLNRMGSIVQVITGAGDKHLIKYQKDANATRDALRRAAMQAGGAPQ